MRIRIAVLLVTGAASLPAAAQSLAGVEQCREQVLPDASELAWRAVPWRASLAQAALEADAQDKPVLLWAMNGHPLGCT